MPCDDDSWLVSTRFPSPAYLAGAAAAGVVGKPWLSRAWRRSADRGVLALVVVMVDRRHAGLAELLARRARSAAWPAPLCSSLSARRTAVRARGRRRRPRATPGLEVTDLTLERAVGGRSQLYRAALVDGTTVFVKVYGRDSRDADLLYRGYRTPGAPRRRRRLAVGVARTRRRARGADAAARPARRRALPRPAGPGGAARRFDGRGHGGRRRAPARHAGVRRAERRPARRRVARGRRAAPCRDRPPGAARGEHPRRRRRTRDHRPRRGRGARRATRRQAIDRAELLASLAALVGPGPATAAAARSLEPGDLAAALRLPPAAGAVGGDAQASLEVAAQGTARRRRRGDGRASRSRSRASSASDRARSS